MKILYVITKANWGGAQKYVFDLACAAQVAGHEIVVAFGTKGELAARLEQRNIRTIVLPIRNEDSISALVGATQALSTLFRKEKPDVVHLNSSVVGVTGAIAARLTGVRNVLFTAHGWAYNEDRPQWQKAAIALLQWLGVLFVHKTLCVSEAIRRDAAWMPFVRNKLVLIHNGAAQPSFITREDARTFLSQNGSIPEPVWIGTIAELHPNKRLDLLIEAFSQISSEFANTALVIMGEGQERKNLEELVARHRLPNRIHLLGHIVDAPKYLRALDLFVLPSHTEALGLSIIEAGFAGLPCIASNVGGIPEIIENNKNGILFERGNVEKLTAALKKLLSSSEECTRLGSALHEKVTREFSLEKMVEQTLALYR